jgi:dCMP deaminase
MKMELRSIQLAKQSELDDVYMGTAILHSQLSKAKRAQVGAVLVTNHGVTLTGFNGTPSGLSNVCEENHWNALRGEYLVTKPEVIHAELNCIMKAAREGVSCIGATVYVTLSPCVQCSAMLVQAGVKRVVYHQLYRDTFGIALLQEAGVEVQQYAKS